MGCDIHGWVEKKIGDKWVAILELNKKARERNYERFAALAGVRGDGPPPRGVPEDLSDTARYHIDKWDCDGHSHSWLPIEAAVKVWPSARWVGKPGPTDFEMKWPFATWFDLEELDEVTPVERADYRVVFWFDN